MSFRFSIQQELFDIENEHSSLSALGPRVGAVVTFVGQVRDEPLFLEHYPALAHRAFEQLLTEAQQRWPLLGARIIHRHGSLAVGEPIVFVGTAAAHRAEAFDAACFLMDWLKTRAPFWKKGAAGWVAARPADMAAAERWHRP